MTRTQEIVDRLAANIYCADQDSQDRPMVLWGMLPPSKQLWYVTTAKRVLKNAASRRAKVAPPPERPVFTRARR
jgi:hypothetical protein